MNVCPSCQVSIVRPGKDICVHCEARAIYADATAQVDQIKYQAQEKIAKLINQMQDIQISTEQQITEMRLVEQEQADNYIFSSAEEVAQRTGFQPNPEQKPPPYYNVPNRPPPNAPQMFVLPH